MNIHKTLHNINWALFASVIGFAGVGLYILNMPDQSLPDMWQHQSGFVIAGMLGFVFFCFVPLNYVRQASWPLYAVALFLMVLIWRIGWKFDLGLLHLQPTEIAEWALILVLARYFATRDALGWKGVPIPLCLLECL